MPASAQAATPTSGFDGRVIDRTNGVILAGVKTWRRMGSATAIPFLHFESAADADGLIHATQLRGQGNNKVRLTGVTMKASSGGTHARLDNGKAVSLDLFVSKGDSLGYQAVVGFVTSFEVGQDIDDKLCDYSAEVTVSGAFPAYGSVAAIA